ncbi:DsrE family protein [Nostocoides sp.]|jgi:predicted peroxiredoxin|uniref:DsrE family protein n=1 Tax=Nostocoides sp. TaxID=1917966 RepID=UPI002CE39444|nr:DsrE family protein [Tetrasphaera sp.]
MTPSPTRLVVKLTAGSEALERANQALTVASTALASGFVVSLWLTGEATWLAVPGRAEQLELEHAAAPAQLLAAILQGGSVTVCSQCAARRGLDLAALLPGTTIRGAASYVEEIMAPATQAIVY